MDLERSPEWAAPVIERHKLTEGPMGIGTTYLARNQFPGRVIEFTVEITEFQPPDLVTAVWDGCEGWRVDGSLQRSSRDNHGRARGGHDTDRMAQGHGTGDRELRPQGHHPRHAEVQRLGGGRTRSRGGLVRAC